MERRVNAELQLDEKSVQRRVDIRMRRRNNRPYATIGFLLERDFGVWCGELVILLGEAHCLSEVRAAQNCKSVHSVRRDMKSQTGVIGKMRVGRESDRVAIALDDLIQRHASR